jgi:hypothetical protein
VAGLALLDKRYARVNSTDFDPQDSSDSVQWQCAVAKPRTRTTRVASNLVLMHTSERLFTCTRKKLRTPQPVNKVQVAHTGLAGSSPDSGDAPVDMYAPERPRSWDIIVQCGVRPGLAQCSSSQA